MSLLKGVEQLLRAVQNLGLSGDCRVNCRQARFCSRRIVLITMVSCDAGIRANIGSRAIHDDESEAQVFTAADLVWLGYVGGAYGSSGVLYQAGSAGLPVISMADGLIGWTVRKHKLGISLDTTDTAKVVDAIERMRNDEPMMREFGENGRRLAKSHTGTAFAKTICDSLAESLDDGEENGSIVPGEEISLHSESQGP